MKFLVVLFLISVARGTIVSYNVPVVAHTIPAAVSHQSRIDLHSDPLVSHAWTPATYAWTPTANSILTGYHGPGHYLKKRSLFYAAPIATVAHTVVAPAVSHQSRYDITTTAGHVPLTTVGHIPLAHSAVWSAPYGHGLGSAWGLGHLLRKRSLVTPFIGHISTPIIGRTTTISKQSLDIVHPTTIHAAPIIHSPIVSHAIPLAHAWTNPIGVHGHFLKKRSLSPLIGHSLVSTPIIGQTKSISKQSLDIVHPTIIHAHSAPILAHSAPISRVFAHSAPIIAHSAPFLAHSAPILAHSEPIYAHSEPIYAHSAPLLAHSAPIASSNGSPWAYYGLSHLGK
ncbi:hypothetical protein O0L34_g10159 [Tuta absoluta]|nr:hypothetical protein O0L34_g10159 [Tuta absoluta]